MTKADALQRLDDEIMLAHDAEDNERLSALYLKAGQVKESGGNIDAACFLFTQAYVYGLDGGNRQASQEARARLVAHGRDK